jgi:hypothetical protein
MPYSFNSPLVHRRGFGARHGASDRRSVLCASLNNPSCTLGGTGALPATRGVPFIEIDHCVLAAPVMEKPILSVLAHLTSPRKRLHVGPAGHHLDSAIDASSDCSQEHPSGRGGKLAALSGATPHPALLGKVKDGELRRFVDDKLQLLILYSRPRARMQLIDHGSSVLLPRHPLFA